MYYVFSSAVTGHIHIKSSDSVALNSSFYAFDEFLINFSLKHITALSRTFLLTL